MFPWMRKNFDESEHPREEHGRFSETAQKHRGLLEEAKKLRSDAFNQAKSDAIEHHEHANSTAAGLEERINNIAWDSDNEDEQSFVELEALISEYDPTGTVNERMAALKDIVVAAKAAAKVEQSDQISNTVQAQNQLELKEIIAGAKKAQEHLRTHAGHRREMAAIKSGENWKSIREIIEKGYPELAMSFPWMILKSGQFTESKHKRGNPKNAGQFSATGGGGGGAKAKPRTSGKVSGPSRGISQPGKGKPPATPYKVQPAGMPPLPQKQPGAQQQQQGNQPHLQTQASAVQAGNAALQEVASGQANGPAKQAFAKALHAHYAAGITALQKMAIAKYGDYSKGPKAAQAFEQASKIFKGKIRAAWAKVNTPQGGVQPGAPAPAQPKQTRIREFTRDQPPPLPKASPAKLASEAIARQQTTIGPSRNDANMSAQDKSDAEVRSNLEKLILGHPQSQKAGLTPGKLAGLKGSQIADIAYKLGIRNSGGATSSRLDPKDTEGGNNPYYFLHPVVETEAEKKRSTAASGSMERTRASNASFHKRTAAKNAAAKKKKSISSDLITKSFDTFSDMDLSVELPDEPLPAWLRSKS